MKNRPEQAAGVATASITPSINSPWVQMAKHVATLFPAGSLLRNESIEIRCFRNRRTGPRAFFQDHGTLIRDAMRWAAAWDVYVGVGTRRCPNDVPIAECPHEKPGGKDHVGRLSAAWCEIDLGKPYETVEQIIDALDAARLKPDLLVSSGGGVHAYLCFDTPTTQLDRVERANRTLVKRVGRDHAIDASRILRLAGTTNFKSSPTRPARILQREPPPCR